MPKIEIQKKQVERPEGGPALRVTHRATHKKGKRTVDPCYNIKCGCCEAKLPISYDPNGKHLEIGEVDGSIENWREILLPLLRFEQKDGEFIDVSPDALKVRARLEDLDDKRRENFGGR